MLKVPSILKLFRERVLLKTRNLMDTGKERGLVSWWNWKKKKKKRNKPVRRDYQAAYLAEYVVRAGLKVIVSTTSVTATATGRGGGGSHWVLEDGWVVFH